MFAAWLTWCLVAFAATPVDVNRANIDELAAIEGVGRQKAVAIVDYRAHYGAFLRLDDLRAVPGIGSATLAAVGARWVVGPVNRRATGHSVAAPQPSESAAVDINVATEAELATLPGVGAIRAADILRERERNGRFRACDDLRRVPGIGPATVAAIGDRCRTDVPDALNLSGLSAARPER